MSASEVLTPEVDTLVLTDADSEYSYSLQGIQHFSIQSRTAADFRFAFVTGRVDTGAPAGPYATCKSGQVINAPEKCSVATGVTLYVSSDNAGQVLEILKWTRRPSV